MIYIPVTWRIKDGQRTRSDLSPLAIYKMRTVPHLYPPEDREEILEEKKIEKDIYSIPIPLYTLLLF